MKTMSTSPFDYVRAINEKRSIDDHTSYTPFLANRAFSYSLDTILLANEMNKYPNLPPEVQFSFMYEHVRKGKRFSKWYKEEENPHLEMVMEYYKYSKQKALAALQVLTQENLRDIKRKMDKGGR